MVPADSSPVILVMLEYDEEPARNISQHKYYIRTVINTLIDR